MRPNHDFIVAKHLGHGLNASTVDGRGKISEPHATGTSKLDWRSLESMQIDRNKVQICTYWQEGTGTKNPENFRNFEKFKEKTM